MVKVRLIQIIFWKQIYQLLRHDTSPKAQKHILVSLGARRHFHILPFRHHYFF